MTRARERTPAVARTGLLGTCGIAALVGGCLLPSGCEDFDRDFSCDSTDPVAEGAVPELLSATGLYADIQAGTVAEGVVEYEPAFELWTDGAKKRRWFWLPPRTQIDTSDPDNWQFPLGTKFWKEFNRDGVRVETRLLMKVGAKPSDWTAIAYVWDGADATASPVGVVDAQGTPHDVPEAGDCWGCHGGRESRVLGFSTVQLGGATGDGALLSQMEADGVFSDALPSPRGIPGNELEKSALGYLYANCSHCHNQQRPGTGPQCYDPDNRLDFHVPAVKPDAVDDMPVYRSAIGRVIRPGSPQNSRLFNLASSRGRDQMPPLGTELVDQNGVQILEEWIRAM